MSLAGLRVLDLSDHAGALCARLLADLGADVVRVEPPGGAGVRRLEPRRGGQSLAHLYVNANKRSVVLDPTTAAGIADLEALVEGADVVVDARSMAPTWVTGASASGRDPLAPPPPQTVLLRVTPFGATGPRAHFRGGDLVCAARSGMTFVNGSAAGPPLPPFGLAAFAATGLVGAIAVLLGLASRARSGRGVVVDLAVVQAAAAAVEHVTGLYRQTGRIQRRQGTLHWSRTFRVGQASDGPVLLSHLGDWTTLSEWVASEWEPARWLTDPRWQDVDVRKEHAETIFGCLDAWVATRSAREVCDGARLRRLPFAPVRRPEELGHDPQLLARRFVHGREVDGETVGFPGPSFRTTAPSHVERRLPGAPGEERAQVLRDWWTAARLANLDGAAGARAGEALPQGARPLDGVVVLDFTWVVAGPVATRLLADHGARVVKVEHRNAPDFGTRRGGLTGNLNRGKQSVVIDLETEAGRALAARLAAGADVVIDNFSARVMDAWGLDYASLCARRRDAIAVRLTGFGLDGPARDDPSYGPTLQAMAGYPRLMRAPDGALAGWGYSWSDMAAGLMGAIATLGALEHRRRTGEGQLVDLSQLENLVSLMGPRVLDLLAGRAPGGPAPGDEEGPRAPHGIFRCAAESGDDDRWIALSVEDDPMWARLAALLARDGEAWASAADLAQEETRVARRAEVERRLASWIRVRRAGDLEDLLQTHGVAAGLVAHGADLLSDPQLRARGHFQNAASPGGEPYEFDGIPFLSSEMPGRIDAPGPLCGEHTDSVLSELLGLGSGDIEALRSQGVIG